MAAGDIKTEYAATTAITITLASLATSSTLLVGRESTLVDNTSTKYLDQLVGGQVMTGTSPTAGTIEVWVAAQFDDAGVWPDVFDGTDSAETCTSADIKQSGLRLLGSVATSSTSNVAYPFAKTSIASLFGGVVPKKWTLFVTHNTAVNLNSTGGNHFFYAEGSYASSAQS